MDDLICKFVYVDGKEIGETVDVYKGNLIVKIGAEFIGVPLSNVNRVEGDKVHLLPYDEKLAAETGRDWVNKKSKPVSLEELKIFGFGESAASAESGKKEDFDTDLQKPETEKSHGNSAIIKEIREIENIQEIEDIKKEETSDGAKSETSGEVTETDVNSKDSEDVGRDGRENDSQNVIDRI
jgi:hypothetical protein